MTSSKKISDDPLFPYFLPFFLFGAFLGLESLHPLAVYALYPVKTFVVALAIAYVWRRLPPFDLKKVGASIGIGIAGFILWVGLEPILVRGADHSHGFNPYLFADSAWGMQLVWGLAFFRILGAVTVVPIMEEVFWRGFLMRFLINMDDFEKVPLGTFRWLSFIVTTAAFALVHGAYWPLGVVVGVLYGWWFVRTRSLGAVMVAHGVTNLFLGAYVLLTHRWYFW